MAGQGLARMTDGVCVEEDDQVQNSILGVQYPSVYTFFAICLGSYGCMEDEGSLEQVRSVCEESA